MHRVTLLTAALLITAIQTYGYPQASSQSFDSTQITKKISPGVVLIKGTSNSGEVLGTGFIISSDGKVATNLHVVESLKNGGVQLASGIHADYRREQPVATRIRQHFEAVFRAGLGSLRT